MYKVIGLLAVVVIVMAAPPELSKQLIAPPVRKDPRPASHLNEKDSVITLGEKFEDYDTVPVRNSGSSSDDFFRFANIHYKPQQQP